MTAEEKIATFDENSDCYGVLCDLAYAQEQLAASQAREQQLREALSDLRDAAQSAGFGILHETLVEYPVAGGARTVKNHSQVKAFEKALAALRLKCDEAIAACASETCAMARERDDYREALEKIAEICDKDGWVCKHACAVLANHSPEDEVEQARRMV